MSILGRAISDVNPPVFDSNFFLEQLCLDFEKNPSDPTLSPASASPESTLPEDFGDASLSTDDNLKDLEHSHGKYIHFSLSMLLTCAEDLTDAHKTISNRDATPKQKEKAQELRTNTLAWLNGEAQSLFSFEECIELLEQELLIQSNMKVNIPNLTDRREHIAKWITEDPARAKDMLRRYKGIFEEKTTQDDWDESHEQNSRPRMMQ